MKKYRAYMLLFMMAIVLDQLSKYAILARWEYGERVNIIPHFFDLTLVYNPGAAFSFLANMGGAQKYIFTVLAFAISAWLISGIVKNEFGKLGGWAAVSIISGAMGNVIDRFFYGYVIDFIHVHYADVWHYPIFNIADIGICVGMALVVIDMLFLENKRKIS